MIKINPLDAHDRLNHFKKQDFSISECCQDMLNKRPFGKYPFYIWVHSRTDEDGFTKRLIWQPRLTKPLSQTNSMLFRAYPGTDTIKILWMIPPREMWNSYKKGQLTEDSIVSKSIQDFEYNRVFLDRTEEDDLSEEMIHAIYVELASEAKNKKMMEKLWIPKR